MLVFVEVGAFVNGGFVESGVCRWGYIEGVFVKRVGL